MTAFFALIPAAGVGQRAGTTVPKQYAPLLGRPMLMHAIAAFAAARSITATHVVVSPADQWIETFGGSGFPAGCNIHRVGGATRAASVLNGLNAIEANANDWILVHDAARPCITPVMIDELVATLRDDEVGGFFALPVSDTVKRADAAGRVAETIPRDDLWLAQTPQMFRYGLLSESLRRFPDVTDEAGAIERMGFKPRLLMGSARNIKVTHPADFAVAEAYLMI
jgi:2-C-methyl-D-erythritol 4-phosphate cytidylyltransferase